MDTQQGTYDEKLANLMQCIKLAKEQSQVCTWKNERGTVVPEKTHKNVMLAFEEVVALAVPAQSEELLKIRSDYEKSMSANLDLRKTLEIASKKVRELEEEFKKLKQKSEDDYKGFSKYEADTLSEIQALRASEKLHKQQAKSFEKQLKSSGAKFAPETAKQVQFNAEEEHGLSVAADVECAKLVAELNAARAERDEANKELANLRNRKNEAVHEVTLLRNMKHLLEVRGELPPIRRVEDNKLLNIFLGKNSVSWLEKLDQVNRADVRDRAFHIMQASMHSDNKRVKALNVLFRSLFEWIKKQSGKTSIMIEAWITQVENDIKDMKIQSLKSYRESLEKIKASAMAKTGSAPAKPGAPQKPRSWWAKTKEHIAAAVVTTSNLFSPASWKGFFKRRATVTSTDKADNVYWPTRLYRNYQRKRVSSTAKKYKFKTPNTGYARVLASLEYFGRVIPSWAEVDLKQCLITSGLPNWDDFLDWQDGRDGYECPADFGKPDADGIITMFDKELPEKKRHGGEFE